MYRNSTKKWGMDFCFRWTWTKSLNLWCLTPNLDLNVAAQTHLFLLELDECISPTYKAWINLRAQMRWTWASRLDKQNLRLLPVPKCKLSPGGKIHFLPSWVGDNVRSVVPQDDLPIQAGCCAAVNHFVAERSQRGRKSLKTHRGSVRNSREREKTFVQINTEGKGKQGKQLHSLRKNLFTIAVLCCG